MCSVITIMLGTGTCTICIWVYTDLDCITCTFEWCTVLVLLTSVSIYLVIVNQCYRLLLATVIICSFINLSYFCINMIVHVQWYTGTVKTYSWHSFSEIITRCYAEWRLVSKHVDIHLKRFSHSDRFIVVNQHRTFILQSHPVFTLPRCHGNIGMYIPAWIVIFLGFSLLNCDPF